MKLIASFLLILIPFSAHSIAPQFWDENNQSSFVDGDPQSISITSEGELVLGPQLMRVYDGPDSIIWKTVMDSKGNLYAASGNEGRIVKIDTSGKSTIFLDTNELEVQSLVLDEDDNLYAATSPNGKVYRIKQDGTSTVFYDPEDKYIWSLSLDESGNLYAGTGDQGKIYKIDKTGKGKLLLDTSETNITVLAWDKKQNLLAGSDRNGILYRIDSTGKAFVLFDSDMQQITSIYCDPAGEIFFAASGGIPAAPEMKPQPEAPVPILPSTKDTDISEGEPTGEVTTTVDVTVIPSATVPAVPRAPGASQLYRISSDGAIEMMYAALEDQILDITEYKDTTILIATGKKAKLILLDKNKKSTILLKSSEEQITSLLKHHQIWLATANPGNIYRLVESHSSQGIYYSDIKDTQTASSWGQISWKATTPPGTAIALSTRSGNTKTPDDTWSAWSNSGTDPAGKQMGIPKARFVQWKAEFSTTNPGITPILHSVRIAFLQQNLRPEIVSITVEPPGTVYRRAAVFPQESFAGMDESQEEDQQLRQNGDLTQLQQGLEQTSLGKREYKKGLQTVTWNATDLNQDELRYDVYYKSIGEKDWKTLSKNLKEKIFAWDTETMPDGTYLVKVVVNDSSSNPKEYALEASKESDPFDVDNSAPTIQVLKNAAEKDSVILEVRAQDQFSAIREMQYSIKPGRWNIIFPLDAINDSPVENFRIELKNLPSESTDVVLKCSDRVHNTTTIRYPLP